MKKLTLFFAIVLIAIGCQDNTLNNVDSLLTIENLTHNEVGFTSQANTITLPITSNKYWKITLADPSASEWLTISPMEGTAGNTSVVINAKTNIVAQSRSAQVNITAGDLTQSFTVKQQGAEGDSTAVLTIQQPEGSELVFENISSSQQISFTTNKTWIVTLSGTNVADWLSVDSVSGAPGVRSLQVNAKSNTTAQIRTAALTIAAGGILKTFVVSQKGDTSINWQSRDFYHKSLLVDIGATWCKYCYHMETVLSRLRDKLPERFVYVNIHQKDSDPKVAYGDDSLIENKFLIENRFPTGIIDLRALVPNTDKYDYGVNVWTNLANESEQKFNPSTGIALTSSLVNGKLTAEVKVRVKHADTYKISVALAESGLVAPQEGVNTSSYIHNNILRFFLTNQMGDELLIAKDGEEWTKTYTYDLPAKVNPANSKLIVYLEKKYNNNRSETVEGAVYKNYGDYYVDNATEAIVGKTVDFRYK